MTELLAVFTTVAREDQAQQLARAAVEQGLAACVQAEPVQSTYRWKGTVTQEPEIRLMFKTTQTQYGALERLLLSLHPYELPAVFALPLAQASVAYGRWVQEAVGESPGTGGV
jgi:periplasmic divalent cation tolerance protein